MSEDAVVDGVVGAVVADRAGDRAGDPAAELAVVKAKLVQAELRAAALKAGMIDLDCVKLVDLSKVAFSPAGEIADAAKVIAGMRAVKPWLFGGSSSSVAVAPMAAEPSERPAMQMSTEEWRAARAALLRR